MPLSLENKPKLYQFSIVYSSAIFSHSCKIYFLSILFRTHTGERPYGCEICSFTSAQSCNLQSHYRRTHGIDPKSNPEQFDKLRRQSAADSSSVISESSAPWTDPKMHGQTTQPFQCCVCEEPLRSRLAAHPRGNSCSGGTVRVSPL